MSMQRLWFTALFLFCGSLPGASEPVWANDAFAPATVGHWTGHARIIVVWATQTDLRVTLDIREDGKVTGTIGDALLINGRLRKNRGWLDRKLNVKTDFIVVGDLQGAIVTSESIRRSHIKIPLDVSGGMLMGGIHTSGSKLGGKEQMILSAAGLKLSRDP